MTRFLLVAAVLASGCEQIKAPKKLKELEGRVDELTAQVEKLSGKPMAARPKADKHEDEGHAVAKEGDGAGAGETKDGEPKEAPAAADSHEAPAAGDSHDAKDADPEEPKESTEPPKEAKESSEPKAAKDHDHDEAAAPEDAGVDALSKDQRALHDIAKLVATTTGTGKKQPADADAKDAKPDEDAKAKAKESKAKDGKDAKDKPATEWGYNAKIGPPVWGSLDPAWRVCESGRNQSPVDIEPRPGKAGPIVFHYKPTPGTVSDNGHGMQVDFGEGSYVEVSDHTYQLVQLNFHTPSEHTIAGEHYPLEAQLVHKDSAGKLTVISVLYDVGPESRTVGNLLAKWPRKPGAAIKLAGIDPSTLLPETRTAFRYTGSLTTPPCTEGLIWNVMRRQLTDSREHLDAFTARYKINARETRPLNDRKIE